MRVSVTIVGNSALELAVRSFYRRKAKLEYDLWQMETKRSSAVVRGTGLQNQWVAQSVIEASPVSRAPSRRNIKLFQAGNGE